MTTKKARATKPTTKKGAGRPALARRGRWPLRRHEHEMEAWRVAAAQCGKDPSTWAAEVLNAEALKPHHVERLGG